MDAPKRIWLQKAPKDYYENEKYCFTWLDKQVNHDDIKYIRADRYAALLDAAVSLHHWLFEMVKAELGDQIGFDEFESMLDDAQLALDKWNRVCDGKAEEE